MPDEKIADLIEKVERLDGPDQATDAAIIAYLNNAIVKPYPPATDFGPHDRWQFWSLDGNHFLGSEHKFPVPSLTGSLDAVLTLVERVRPGWVPALEFGDPGADSTTMRSHIAKLRPNMRDDIGWQTSGVVRGSSLASMPLAVLSALLRSIQGTEA